MKKVNFSRIGLISITLFFTNIATVKADTAGRQFKVSTFNIEWFGLGGAPENSPNDEHRDANIKSIIQNNLSDTDVLVVEEVVDLERLETNVLAQGWVCQTYFNRNPKHQHVGICVRPGLKLLSEPSDDNDIIDEVASDPERSRPALHLIVADSSSQPLFRVIGLHLKANPEFTTVRMTQVDAITKYIKNLNSNLPVVITGDFNTYDTSLNRQSLDDDVMISKSWKTIDLEQSTGNYFTYKTPKYSSHFDRFWLSTSLKVNGIPTVLPNCQYSQNKPDELQKIIWYNHNVSDHCPVTVSFKL